MGFLSLFFSLLGGTLYCAHTYGCTKGHRFLASFYNYITLPPSPPHSTCRHHRSRCIDNLTLLMAIACVVTILCVFAIALCVAWCVLSSNSVGGGALHCIISTYVFLIHWIWSKFEPCIACWRFLKCLYCVVLYG